MTVIPDDPAPADSFPRLSARTARFTLGQPRNLSVTDDGSKVLFVRSKSGTDRSGALWCFDVASGTERLLADPAALLGGADEALSDAERARRERARETGAGIIGYSADTAGRTAVFTLSGGLWACDIASGDCTQLAAREPVIDPRIDPTGRRVAYASDGALRIVDLAPDGGSDRALVEPDGSDIVWGQAEFVAAEEMGRMHGFWWAPDGEALLVERYDNSPVRTWYLADPAHPERAPQAVRYPAAGTANAAVELWHITLDGTRHRVHWDSDTFPYLTSVAWTEAGRLFTVMTRDQRHARTFRVELGDGQHGAPTVTIVADSTDPGWVEMIENVPALTPDGRLVSCEHDYTSDSTRRLAVDGVPFSPQAVQIRRVRAIDNEAVTATVSTDPTEQQLARLGFDGSIEYISVGRGLNDGAVGGSAAVVVSSRLDSVGTNVTVLAGDSEIGALRSFAADPGFVPRVAMQVVGERQLRVAVVLPRDHRPGSARLPVIMNPYGGPHAQRVRASAAMFLQAQWFADQGFAVVIADGRGSPGRGPAWEREVLNEFATVTLQDQVDALAGVARLYPNDLDTDRVGITGWSFGGYLAALAVLDRPDVFHAAVAGAPVTDWTLYDTCYTERFLGDPTAQPDVYERNSLLGRAGRLTRPLLIIHGMVDDNVVVAHSLRLSSALLAAGKAHQVLPLTGITHMASDEVVAENLLLAQVDFLRSALVPPATPASPAKIGVP